MSHLTVVPISQAEHKLVRVLMDEEKQIWKSELDWDYSLVLQILRSHMDRNLLPGYLARYGDLPVGYTYFVIHRRKGIIGTLYASHPSSSQEIAEQVLTKAIDSLKNYDKLVRIEAQIIPFNGLDPTSIFERSGFEAFPRNYLDLDLDSYRLKAEKSSSSTIITWNSVYLAHAAKALWESYQNEIDARICGDYCSPAGCESYLRSLIENPGCGIFLPEASFISLDEKGIPCGFVISSTISHSSAMIPQIAIRPSHQGNGLGRSLIKASLRNLNSMGFRRVSLTVTRENTRASSWYQRLGFNVRKEFGAYVWQRSTD